MTCEISCMRMRFQNKRYIKVERWNDHKITLIGKQKLKATHKIL